MNIKRIPAQLEISFWSTVIPLMSETPPLRRLIQGIYDLIQGEHQYRVIKQAMIWSGTGLLLGFVLGLLMGTFSG